MSIKWLSGFFVSAAVVAAILLASTRDGGAAVGDPIERKARGPKQLSNTEKTSFVTIAKAVFPGAGNIDTVHCMRTDTWYCEGNDQRSVSAAQLVALAGANRVIREETTANGDGTYSTNVRFMATKLTSQQSSDFDAVLTSVFPAAVVSAVVDCAMTRDTGNVIASCVELKATTPASWADAWLAGTAGNLAGVVQ